MSEIQEIEKLRGELDQIHTELTDLLRQRLVITEKIWKIKVEKQLPFTDEKRELAIFHRFDDTIPEAAERSAIQNILRSIVGESKKYNEMKLSQQQPEKTSNEN